MENMAAAKAALRTTISSRLKNLTQAQVTQQSDAVVTNALRLPQYQKARSIGVYLSMPTGEIQTREIVQDALRTGKSVFVPYIERGVLDMRMFRLADLEDFESLNRDKWGIPSLPAESLADREEANDSLDLIFMPGVAFAHGSLKRLGHGKGYYDRFLSSHKKTGGGETPLLGMSLQSFYLCGQAPEA